MKPILRAVPAPSRRRKLHPPTPIVPKLDVSGLSPEKARHLIRIAGRSGVSHRPSLGTWIAGFIRAFARMFAITNGNAVAENDGATTTKKGA